MKMIKTALSSLLVFLPVVALAHVKWFAQEKEYVRPYSISDGFVISWIIVSVLIVLAGVYFERKISLPRSIVEKFKRIAPYVHSIAQIGFGISLIIFSIKGFIFAPNLPVEGLLSILMRVVEFISGAMILLGYFERLGAILVLALFFMSVYLHGAIEMLDALEVFGFSLYLLIYGRPNMRLSNKFNIGDFQLNEYAVPILRIFTGLNLFVLGFSEKILNPSLTQNFLEVHNWNFMDALGFHMFTNYWFAFSAGVVESLFGVFLILGLVTRFTTVTLAIFLASTLVLLGPVELMGHLPHFSIAIIFLILGSGDRLKIQ